MSEVSFDKPYIIVISSREYTQNKCEIYALAVHVCVYFTRN